VSSDGGYQSVPQALLGKSWHEWRVIIVLLWEESSGPAILTGGKLDSQI
jgi:hypothetical protein